MGSLCALDKMAGDWSCNVCSWQYIFCSTDRFIRNFTKQFFSGSFWSKNLKLLLKYSSHCSPKDVIARQNATVSFFLLVPRPFDLFRLLFSPFYVGFFFFCPSIFSETFWLLAFWHPKVLNQKRPPLDDMPVWTPIAYYFHEMDFFK